MFRHEKTQKAMAFALVAMLALCSASIFVFDADAANNNNETYTISLRVGDTFSYTPQVNLSSTDGASVTIGIDESSSEGMSDCWKDGTFTFAPSDTEQKTVKFKASWEKGSLKQYAYQTIVFNTFTDISVSGGESPAESVMADAAVGKVLYAPAVFGGISPYTYSATIPDAIKSCIGWDSSSNSLKVTASIPESLASATPYEVVIAITDTGFDAGEKSNALEASTATVRLSLTIAEGYVIVAQTYFETFAGDLDDGEVRTDSFDVSTNASVVGGFTSESFAVSATDASGNAVDGFATYSDGKVAIDVSKAGFTGTESGSNAIKDFTVKITATGTHTDGVKTADATVKVRVFADLKFISEPTISGSVASPTANSTMDVLMTATFANATSIRYVWGDGTETTVVPSGTDSSKYSARHVYQDSGVYFITVYASNDRGTAKLVTMYNASTGASQVVDDAPEKGFFEEHGWQFVVFGIIAVLLLAMFFVAGVQSPWVIIGAIIMAMLCILTFVYHDLGGIADALKGILP